MPKLEHRDPQAVFDDLLASWYTAEHQATQAGTGKYKTVTALNLEYRSYEVWRESAKNRGNLGD